MSVSLEYVRDSIVKILESANYTNILYGVIASYEVCNNNDTNDVTMSVLPLVEDNIFPDISLRNKDSLINSVQKVYEIKRPNEYIFHKDHFNNNFNNKGKHFELEIKADSIVTFDNNKIKIGEKDFKPINKYFEILKTEINKESSKDYKLINSIDQCYFSSGCKNLLIIPIPLLSTPVFLLVLDKNKLKKNFNTKKLIHDVYNLSKVTVRHFILTNLIDGLKEQLATNINQITSAYKLIFRFKDELCKILLPIEWEIGVVLDTINNKSEIKKGEILCCNCTNQCGKSVNVDDCINTRYLFDNYSKKSIVRIGNTQKGQYLHNWPSPTDNNKTEDNFYYFHFFISLSDDNNKQYVICLKQTSFKFPDKKNKYIWIQELPEYEIAASQLGTMLSSIFSLIYNQWKEIQKVKQHAIRAANISILVDSYSHNVTAHSMATLLNFFATRKKMLEDRQICSNITYNSTDTVALKYDEIKRITEYSKKIKKLFTGLDNTDDDGISISDLIKYNESNNANEFLQKWFSFRQNGNTIDSIYTPVPIDDNIYSYLNYLSEKSEFWSAVIAGESFNNSISTVYDLVWAFVDNPLFIGTIAGTEKIHKIKFIVNNQDFCTVDFTLMNNPEQLTGNYQFVNPGSDFQKVKEDLSKKNILLPGSTVGKQSVYTIFENCLRNIKHYDISTFTGDKELKFHLDFIENDNQNQYEFSLYLGLEKFRNNETVKNVVDLIHKQIKRGTYDEAKNKPVFGGTSQSILCANQIATGRFTGNEEKDENHFSVKVQDEKYISYKFPLWKGETVAMYSEIKSKNNNFQRYKFLTYTTDEEIKDFDDDLIRLVKTQENAVEKVYESWLNYWLGKFSPDKCKIVNNDGNALKLILNDKEFEFGHRCDEGKNLVFRNHGVFKKLIPNNELAWKNNYKFDVSEAMLTGIYAIDNRLYNVIIGKNNIPALESDLNLFIKEESDNSLKNTKNRKIINFENDSFVIKDSIHFLIIHLSYLEALDNSKYKGAGINDFIERIEQALNGRTNFRLIITTGRGRTDWYNEIKLKNRKFVTYRSVFSLQTALMDAVMIDDDFNLKYNFVKVLFGS